MFVVRVQAALHPEHRERALAQLQRESTDVPHLFPGCRQFQAFVDPHRPEQFLLYEEWDDEVSFDAYRQSEYFADAGTVLYAAMAGAPDSAYFAAERVGP